MWIFSIKTHSCCFSFVFFLRYKLVVKLRVTSINYWFESNRFRFGNFGEKVKRETLEMFFKQKLTLAVILQFFYTGVKFRERNLLKVFSLIFFNSELYSYFEWLKHYHVKIKILGSNPSTPANNK